MTIPFAARCSHKRAANAIDFSRHKNAVTSRISVLILQLCNLTSLQSKSFRAIRTILMFAKFVEFGLSLRQKESECAGLFESLFSLEVNFLQKHLRKFHRLFFIDRAFFSRCCHRVRFDLLRNPTHTLLHMGQQDSSHDCALRSETKCTMDRPCNLVTATSVKHITSDQSVKMLTLLLHWQLRPWTPRKSYKLHRVRMLFQEVCYLLQLPLMSGCHVTSRRQGSNNNTRAACILCFWKHLATVN